MCKCDHLNTGTNTSSVSPSGIGKNTFSAVQLPVCSGTGLICSSFSAVCKHAPTVCYSPITKNMDTLCKNLLAFLRLPQFSSLTELHYPCIELRCTETGDTDCVPSVHTVTGSVWALLCALSPYSYSVSVSLTVCPQSIQLFGQCQPYCVPSVHTVIRSV